MPPPPPFQSNDPVPPLSRRSFLRRTSTAAVVALHVPRLLATETERPVRTTVFRSAWEQTPDRVWPGEQYWSNPLQDWRVADGRLECVRAQVNRNVHLLTHALDSTGRSFVQTVRVGPADARGWGEGRASVGFRIGVQGPLGEYRNNLFASQGLDAGIGEDGRLGWGQQGPQSRERLPANTDPVVLRMEGRVFGGEVDLRLSAHTDGGRELAMVGHRVPATRLAGNLSLVCNYARHMPARRESAESGRGRFWFEAWTLSGDAVTTHPERAFGPVLFASHTLHRGTLKLTAQMPPLGAEDSPEVTLEVRDEENAAWRPVATAPIEPAARVAVFRIAGWADDRDQRYRLVYQQRDRRGGANPHVFTGTIRKDPVDRRQLSVADVSCNFHTAFPNAEYTRHVGKLDPDLLAFVGDQFYEASGGYGIETAPPDRAMLDYLRKWYLHGWTWRELMRDRPCVSLPDDHDIYQGNLWGEGGRDHADAGQAAGGYGMPAAWINVVHRTQTAHHPDPHDPRPGARGVTNWYGPLQYGGISFAILADRQYKSGPEGKVPPTDSPRGDHVHDPDFDPRRADLAGLDLLGEEQEAFLRTWGRDWQGAAMKAVISQTVFTAMATTHGPKREILRMDYDANGWPQTPRNRAVRLMRRAGAFHIAGDQHLPAVVQYGIDTHRDGPVAFAGPAVNVGYQRWWEPHRAPWLEPTGDGLTGDFTDAFGLPLTVWAVANGEAEPDRSDVMRFMTEKSSGLGLVTFDKDTGSVTVECWPFRADPTVAGTQFPGWPLRFELWEHHGAAATAHLPSIRVNGLERPLVEVWAEATDELVYAMRMVRPTFQPHVFAAGSYTVRIVDPDTNRRVERRGLRAEAQSTAQLVIPFPGD